MHKWNFKHSCGNKPQLHEYENRKVKETHVFSSITPDLRVLAKQSSPQITITQFSRWCGHHCRCPQCHLSRRLWERMLLLQKVSASGPARMDLQVDTVSSIRSSGKQLGINKIFTSKQASEQSMTVLQKQHFFLIYHYYWGKVNGWLIYSQVYTWTIIYTSTGLNREDDNKLKTSWQERSSSGNIAANTLNPENRHDKPS